MQPAFAIPFKSSLHKRVLDEVNGYIRMAESRNNDLKDDWDEAEKECRAYVTPTEEVSRDKSRRKSGKDEYVQVVLPFSAALMMSAYTYWSSVFLSRNPIWQFQGVSPDTENNTLAIEALLNFQVVKGKQLVPLHIWLQDVGKYGRGIIGTYWEEEQFSFAEMVTKPVIEGGVALPDRMETSLERRMMPGYKGNRLYNVRPHDFLPDPRVSLPNFQNGEFCGVIIREVNYNYLLEQEAAGVYFNIDEVNRHQSRIGGPEGGSPDVQFPSSERADISQIRYRDRDRKNCDLHEMIVKLVPSMWGLDAKGKYPEKWIFTIANKSVIIGCRPLGCLHNKFPFSVLEYEIDGYTLSSRGIPKLLSGLNYTLSWLLNSHFYNVRQIMNGSIIYDPVKIDSASFTDKGPGKLIRLRQGVAGNNVIGSAIDQLTIPDMTHNNITDMQVIIQLMQQIVGVTDQVMGMFDSGGRKSATEVRTSTSMGVNRLKVNAEYFSSMGFDPLASMMLSQSQQFYQGDELMRVVGDQMQLPDFTQVDPTTIAGDFQYLPVDGTLPIDRFAQASLWKEVLQITLPSPVMMSQIDATGILGWIAMLSGMKNFNRFKINVQPPGAAPPQGGNVVALSGRQVPAAPVGQIGAPA